MDISNLPDNVTIDDLDRNDFKLLQLKDGFRFGTDMTLLAWFTASFVRRNIIKTSKKQINVLELGSNTGAGSMLFCARFLDILRDIFTEFNVKDMDKFLHLDAVEINEPSFNLLCENTRINGLCNIVTPINSDLRELPSDIRNKQYDIIFFNPPFFTSDKGPSAQNNDKNEDARLIGRFEENGNLYDFINTAAKRVVPDSGHVILIMQAGRLSDVLLGFNNSGLKPTRIINIHPGKDKNAALFMIAGRKTVKDTDFRILPPLILNEENNESGKNIPTIEIQKIYNEVHQTCFI